MIWSLSRLWPHHLLRPPLLCRPLRPLPRRPHRPLPRRLRRRHNPADLDRCVSQTKTFRSLSVFVSRFSESMQAAGGRNKSVKGTLHKRMHFYATTMHSINAPHSDAIEKLVIQIHQICSSRTTCVCAMMFNTMNCCSFEFLCQRTEPCARNGGRFFCRNFQKPLIRLFFLVSEYPTKVIHTVFTQVYGSAFRENTTIGQG